MDKRRTPYHGSSPDWSHYRFHRKSGLYRWHFTTRRRALLDLAAEFLGWAVAFAALFFLFAVALGA